MVEKMNSVNSKLFLFEQSRVNYRQSVLCSVKIKDNKILANCSSHPNYLILTQPPSRRYCVAQCRWSLFATAGE